MLFLSIGSTGDHPLVFLLAHLDPVVEVSQENDLGVQILAEESVEDARDGGVALLGLFLLCGEVAVDELEGLAQDGYFNADCALVPYQVAQAGLEPVLLLDLEHVLECLPDQYGGVQAAHGLTRAHHIPAEHFHQHILPLILGLAAEGQAQRALAFLRAEVNHIRSCLKRL